MSAGGMTGASQTATLEEGEDGAALARGATVGRYVLLDRLGAGAMGVVHAAYDPELDRKVALKVLQVWRSEGSGDARLLREAQALARLAHPNVVAVHDVGVHEGRVYIAMEFVAGQTLGAWAKERPRVWSEALAVLAQAAAGVAAAHAAGVVHRDLKPDNVMIGSDGRVRVMDFGLAHGRGGEPSAGTSTSATSVDVSGLALARTAAAEASAPAERAMLELRLTHAGAVLGTPAYMAPEQWGGEEAGVAADQFSWCVMAWELLYGARPFAANSMWGLQVAVLRGERAPVPRGRRVPGWLRRVIDRGLATRPEQRWPAMAELLAALTRGRTRARVRVGVGVLAVAAGLAGGVGGLQQFAEARRISGCSAAGAEISTLWNDEVRGQVRDAFAATGVNYAAVAAEKVMPWLDEQVTAWQAARTEVCMRVEVLAQWDADTQRRALWCLDERRLAAAALVAEFTRADEQTVRKAVAAGAGLAAVGPCVDAELLRRLPSPPEQGLATVGEVRRALSAAESLQQAGKFTQALAAATSARERAEREVDWRPLLVAARRLEGSLQRDVGAYKESEATLAEVYFAAADAGAWDVAVAASTALVYLVGHRLARSADGEMWARHARLAIVQAGDPEQLREATRLVNLATTRGSAGAYAEAETLYARALEIREGTLGAKHPLTAQAIGGLASMKNSLGAYAEARTLSERVLEIRMETLGPAHPEVAEALGVLARVLLASREYAEAAALRERALAIQERALGPEHPDIAETLGALAVIRYSLDEMEEALALYRRALAIQEKSLPADHPDLARTLNNTAVLYKGNGRLAEALALYERARGIQEATQGPDHPDLAATLNNIAGVYVAMQDSARAVPLLERALAIREKALGPNHPAVAEACTNLGQVYLDLRSYEQARVLLTRAVEIYRKALGEEDPDVGAALTNLAALHAMTREFATSRALYERALALKEKAYGPDHPLVAITLGGWAQTEAKDGRWRAALPLYERSVEIFGAQEGEQDGEPEARFGLAEALIATRGDRARAIREAEAARNGYRALEAADGAAEVEAWLTRHARR